jgi:hypothetical protein
MAWFRNRYQCDRCEFIWDDEWSCTCDDDCPSCGARHLSPCESHDLSEIITKQDGAFVVFRSADTAERTPDYQQVGVFSTLELAGANLDTG